MEQISYNITTLKAVLDQVEESKQLEFLKYIGTGEATQPFLDFINQNENLQNAVNIIFEAQLRACEVLKKKSK